MRHNGPIDRMFSHEQRTVLPSFYADMIANGITAAIFSAVQALFYPRASDALLI